MQDSKFTSNQSYPFWASDFDTDEDLPRIKSGHVDPESPRRDDNRAMPRKGARSIRTGVEAFYRTRFRPGEYSDRSSSLVSFCQQALMNASERNANTSMRLSTLCCRSRESVRPEKMPAGPEYVRLLPSSPHTVRMPLNLPSEVAFSLELDWTLEMPVFSDGSSPPPWPR